MIIRKEKHLILRCRSSAGKIELQPRKHVSVSGKKSENAERKRTKNVDEEPRKRASPAAELQPSSGPEQMAGVDAMIETRTVDVALIVTVIVTLFVAVTVAVAVTEIRTATMTHRTRTGPAVKGEAAP